MTQHQGQCTACKIAWVWTRRVALRDQVCARCGGKLAVIRKADTGGSGERLRENGFTWITWEGYKP